MFDVFKSLECGCEVEVTITAEYGCGVEDCPGENYWDSARLVATCPLHTTGKS